MDILFLGPADSPVAHHLRRIGETVSVTADLIDPRVVTAQRPDFLVSHGYRHIIRHDVLAAAHDRTINLHISYLPWNRGADPNLWSWIEDTPKGVTIHFVDEHLDTGDIIAQRQVAFGSDETLGSSYARLQHEMLTLFTEQWPLIRAGRCERRPQRGTGSAHRVADRAAVEHLLVDGWDTPVAALARR
ncbi:MAG TPA: formyltransferase family protein [Solirubrobacteraceae bacterium]|nr:formyltransferase family protein [Solirubrobacteraceae bacterium]